MASKFQQQYLVPQLRLTLLLNLCIIDQCLVNNNTKQNKTKQILCDPNPNLEAFGENKNTNVNFNYGNRKDNDKIASEFDNGSENGPIIAVSPANKHDQNFGHKCVRLYSLMDQQYIMVHRFRTKVHGIASCGNALVIVMCPLHFFLCLSLHKTKKRTNEKKQSSHLFFEFFYFFFFFFWMFVNRHWNGK